MRPSLRRAHWIACACLVGVSSCSQDSGAPSARFGGDGASPPAQAASADFATLLANADVKRGQTLFLQCRACHSVEAGEPHKVGPNLHGMFGRKAGLAEGYAYSPALADSDMLWTPETVNEWLERPSEFLPGNRMIFIGVKEARDRADLIAYLQQATAEQPAAED